MGESLTGHIRTAENPADLATKVIGNGQKRRSLVNKLLYDLYNHHEEGDDQDEDNRHEFPCTRCSKKVIRVSWFFPSGRPNTTSVRVKKTLIFHTPSFRHLFERAE